MTFEEMQSILERTVLITERNTQIVESNSRAIQAMLDQAATDRLRDEEQAQLQAERTRQHEERMQRLEAMSAGLINLSSLIDEDRPTILRLLNSNNNKLDLLLDRLPPQT
jgi:hypothetical protein